MTNSQSIHIGILHYPDAKESTILGLKDLFDTANHLALQVKEQSFPNIKISIINLEGKINYTDIAFLKSFHPEKDFSVLIVPPDYHGIPSVDKNELYIKFLQCHYQKGTILASVGTGAFLLAHTGLLKNKLITTHWKYGNIFKKTFPNVCLDLNELLVDDIDIITTSGGMCWGDLALCLIQRLLGPIVMSETAKMCLLQPFKKEQRYFSIFEPNLHHGDLSILKVQRWIESTQIKKKITLNQLSKIAKLKIRTLQRRFLKATGLNITEYLQRYRVHQSQVFLQFTQMPLKQIAFYVGYYDNRAFTKVFTKIVGLKPATYRQLFSVIQ